MIWQCALGGVGGACWEKKSQNRLKKSEAQFFLRLTYNCKRAVQHELIWVYVCFLNSSLKKLTSQSEHSLSLTHHSEDSIRSAASAEISPQHLLRWHYLDKNNHETWSKCVLVTDMHYDIFFFSKSILFPPYFILFIKPKQ